MVFLSQHYDGKILKEPMHLQQMFYFYENQDKIEYSKLKL